MKDELKSKMGELILLVIATFTMLALLKYIPQEALLLLGYFYFGSLFCKGFYMLIDKVRKSK